jgi:ParB-like chromosome segregation protein Spo0J
MQFHEIADVFPMLETHDLDQLAKDIKDNGLRHPVVVFEGKILDGRNRLRACQLAGVKYSTVDFDGDWEAAVKLVASENLHRRHLSDSQRSFCAGKLANLRQGRPGENRPMGRFSQADAASMLNISERGVRRARKVIEAGVPELGEAVERGDISVRAAAELTKLPEQEQRAALAAGEQKVRERVAEVRSRRREPSEAQQAVRRKARTDDLFLNLIRVMAEVKGWVAQIAEGGLTLNAEQQGIGLEVADQFVTLGEWMRTLFASGAGMSDEALRAWLAEGDK